MDFKSSKTNQEKTNKEKAEEWKKKAEQIIKDRTNLAASIEIKKQEYLKYEQETRKKMAEFLNMSMAFMREAVKLLEIP